MERLKGQGWPLLLCANRTRTHLHVCSGRLGRRHLIVLQNSLAGLLTGADAQELGVPLRETPRRSNTGARRFGDWSAAQVRAAAGLRLVGAGLARQREVDEPSVAPGRFEAMLKLITKLGARWTAVGLFHHEVGPSGRVGAVKRLSDWNWHRHRAMITASKRDGLRGIGPLGPAAITF